MMPEMQPGSLFDIQAQDENLKVTFRRDVKHIQALLNALQEFYCEFSKRLIFEVAPVAVLSFMLETLTDDTRKLCDIR